MRHAAVLLLSLIMAAPATAAADPPLTRQQALRALAEPDAAIRRAAAAQLSEVGRMVDVPALVRALRDRDEETREIAERAIWAVWAHSGDSEIDALYRQGVEQMDLGLSQEAIATFSRVIRRKPGFAEGWNKRATLYYSLGEYEKSLHDCAEVIKRNPLHFGALAGYGLIYSRLDQPERALGYFKRALRINPNMQGVVRNIELLQKLLDEKRQRYV
jgi:tetratricopeptide (TPR) repeat protein